MQQVRLGRSSLRVSRLSLGAMGFGDTGWRSWVLALEESRTVFRRALDGGISLIDTCDYYSAGMSETIVGALIAEVGCRGDLVIATKAGNPMGKFRQRARLFAQTLVRGGGAVATATEDRLYRHLSDPYLGSGHRSRRDDGCV